MKSNKYISFISNLMLFCIVSFCLVAGFKLGNSNKVDFVNATNSSGIIYAGNRDSNNVSLMINVYWGTEYIDEILNVLDSYNAKCTFFVGGSWVASNPSTLSKIALLGHEIGNHGYYHKDHSKLDATRNREEIYNTHRLVETYLGGTKMNLFAPPSGTYNKTMVAVASELGYKTIMWTRDTIDWRDKDSNLVYNRAVRNISGGDLILMHPTSHTLEALPKILEYIKSKGLVANTVSKTLEK